MNESNILNQEAFKNVDPRKLKLLVEMFNEMGTQPVDQKIQVLFSYGLKMKQMGLQFKPEESKAIMSVLKQNLSPEEKNKIEMMEKMMSMMNK